MCGERNEISHHNYPQILTTKTQTLAPKFAPSFAATRIEILVETEIKTEMKAKARMGELEKLEYLDLSFNDLVSFRRQVGICQTEEDCSKAISLDEKNVKPYLLRGIARESLLCYKELLLI
ncbi:hypothetical protein Droror1_Dr00025081 [Drosera rotundifolia]